MYAKEALLGHSLTFEWQSVFVGHGSRQRSMHAGKRLEPSLKEIAAQMASAPSSHLVSSTCTISYQIFRITPRLSLQFLPPHDIAPCK